MPVTGEAWLQAQYSVLGSALIDPRAVPAVMSGTCEADYNSACKNVYAAMRKLFERGDPVDPVSVNDALGGKYIDFIKQLMDITPTAANVEYYAKLCRQQSKIHAVQSIAGDIIAADSVDDVRRLIEQAAALMVDKNRDNVMDAPALLRDFMNRQNNPANYMQWPIAACNDEIQSSQGDFIIIGAEPSVGKTAFALQCAWFLSKSARVGFFSFETSSQKLFDRKMASEAGLDMRKIKHRQLTQQDWDNVWKAQPSITSANIKLIQAAGYSTADIRAEIMSNGFDIVVIDYIQLVTSRGHNRYEQVTNVSLDLHAMAQRMGVTIIGLSQLSRTDDDRRPRNSDLRESGQLEQDADVILMLWHEKKSNPRGNRWLTATKNKEGELFEVLLAFDGAHQIFTKALRTGETVAKYVADGKKARRQNREPEQVAFAELPNDTQVPF